MQRPKQRRAVGTALKSKPKANADGTKSSALRDAVRHLHLSAEVYHGLITPQQDIQQLKDERSSMQQAMHAVLARIGESIESLSGEDAKRRLARVQPSGADAVTFESTIETGVDVKAFARDSVQRNPVALADTSRLQASETPTYTGTDVVTSRQEARKATAGWHWKRPRVTADKPQDVSDESGEPDEDDLTGSESESSPRGSSRASPDEGSESSDGGADGADMFMMASSGRSSTSHKDQGWRTAELESSAVVQRLLAAIKVDARMRVLEDLDLDFSQRHAALEKETHDLEDLEMNLQKENDQAEQTSADLLQTLDRREANIYRVLRRYGHTVSGLVEGKMLMELPAPSSGTCAQHIEELRALRGKLLEEETKAGDGKSGMPKPPSILEVISAVQEDIDLLRRAVDVEVTRLQACEYAERELDRAVQSASDAPLLDPVVSQVVVEVRQAARLGSQTGGPELEEDMFEHVARLTKEREWLRGEVRRQQVRASAIAAGAAEEDLPKHSACLRMRERRRSVSCIRPTRLKEGNNTQLSLNTLFGKDAQQEHKQAIRILCDRAAQFEQQISDIQDFKQEAANSVPVIEETARTFDEVIQQAKRYVQLGQLPDEGERAERLLAELRNVNQELSRKQEAEHAKEMQRLKSLEDRFKDEHTAIDEQLVQLNAAVMRQEGQNKRILKNLELVASRTHDAVERLQKLDPLNRDEVQQEYGNSLQTAAKMNRLLEEENITLREALRATSNSATVYEHVRAAAAELLSSKAAVLEQSMEEADNEWWSLVTSSHEVTQTEEGTGPMLSPPALTPNQQPTAATATTTPKLHGHSHELLHQRQPRQTTQSRSLDEEEEEEKEVDKTLNALSTKAARLFGGPAKLPRGPAARKVHRSATFYASSSVEASIHRMGRRCSTHTTLLQLNDAAEHVSDRDVGQMELPRWGSKGRPNDILPAGTRSEAINKSLCGLANPTKLLAQRQRHRLQQQLVAAEKDEHKATKFKEKAAGLKRAAAAMENRLVVALGLRNKTQLPEELKPRHSKAVVPERVQVLQQEVRAQTAELQSLSKRWRKICTAVFQDNAQQDLRQELDKLCGKALRHRGQIYVRNKQKEHPNFGSVGPHSPSSHIAEDSQDLKVAVSDLPSPSSAQADRLSNWKRS